MYYHTHDSRRCIAGFPDLVLAKAGRLIFAELKNQKHKASDEQIRWLIALGNTGAESYLWRPEDLDAIISILGGTPPPPREENLTLDFGQQQ